MISNGLKFRYSKEITNKYFGTYSKLYLADTQLAVPKYQWSRHFTIQGHEHTCTKFALETHRKIDR